MVSGYGSLEGATMNDWSGWVDISEYDWSKVSSFSVNGRGGNEPDGRTIINLDTIVDRYDETMRDNRKQYIDAIQMSGIRPDNNPFTSVVYEYRIQVRCDDDDSSSDGCDWFTIVQEKLGRDFKQNKFMDFMYNHVKLQVRQRISRDYYTLGSDSTLGDPEESQYTRNDKDNLKIIVGKELI